jgi:hypothetical protein
MEPSVTDAKKIRKWQFIGRNSRMILRAHSAVDIDNLLRWNTGPLDDAAPREL